MDSRKALLSSSLTLWKISFLNIFSYIALENKEGFLLPNVVPTPTSIAFLYSFADIGPIGHCPFDFIRLLESRFVPIMNL